MIILLDCNICGRLTLHKESSVTDGESATVWHCLNCANERRPNEPGSPNQPSKLPTHPFKPADDLALSIPGGR
jgi:hypothetical protein